MARAWWRATGVSLACALMVVSCTATPGGSSQQGGAVDTSKLVIAVPTLGAQDFTPWLAGDEIELVTGMIGETLTRINPKTGDLEPGLADSWSLSPDFKTWSFKLKPNVPFQGGYGNVTSEDVKFSFGQWIRKDSNQSQSQFYSAVVGGDLEKGFQIVSPTEFKLVTTSTPVIFFPTAASSTLPGIPIQSKKYFDANPAKALSNPIGSGPWEFVSSTPGVELKLKAVEGHYRGTPAFKSLTWRIIKDDAARLSALRAGEVDMAPLSPTLSGEAKAAGVRLQNVADVAALHVIMGGQVCGGYPGTLPESCDRNAPWIQADHPERGLAVRQAINMSIDRKLIIEKVLFGNATQTHSPALEFPSNPQTFDPTWPYPEFNIAKAKAKLAEGGYPNGFETAAWLYDDYTASRLIQEAVYGQIEQIGIKLKREIVDYAGVIRPAIRKPWTGTTGHIWASQSGFKPEAVLLIGNSNIPGAVSMNYNHPGLFPTYNLLNNEPDLTKRYKIARDLELQLIKDAYTLPLWASTFPVGLGKKIGTWSPIPGLEKITNIESITAAK